MCGFCTPDEPAATAETFLEKVNNGVTMLDEKYPGWLDVINLGTFNLSDPWYCVLGQTAQALLASTYQDELAKLNGWDSYDRMMNEGTSQEITNAVKLAVNYGFAVQVPNDFEVGTQVWRDVIVALKLARKPVPDTSVLV